VVLDIQ
jgi:hypothetical protein